MDRKVTSVLRSLTRSYLGTVAESDGEEYMLGMPTEEDGDVCYLVVDGKQQNATKRRLFGLLVVSGENKVTGTAPGRKSLREP